LGADSRGPPRRKRPKTKTPVVKKVSHKLHNFSQISFFFNLNSENIFKVSLEKICEICGICGKKLYTKLTLTD